jgi:hypothetical protein
MAAIWCGTASEGDVPQWTINGRFTFDGHATVEADTAEEAIAKFNSGDIEVDMPTASLCDWEKRGQPVSSD